MPILFQPPNLNDDGKSARQVTIASRVYDVLRQAIIQLQLKPGNPLSEADIARQLGVSRQPVREAFIKLAENGLVEVRPQRGTFVQLISVRDVTNAQFLREVIEVAVVSRAASKAAPEDISNLFALIDDQAQAATLGDNVAFLRLDEKFHQTIARSAGCEDAWRVIEGLKAQMDRVRYLSLPQATPLSTILKQHKAIADAIQEGDAGQAADSMRAHLGEILNSLPRLATEHSDLFAE